MASQIEFVRLTDIPFEDILDHMSDPRLLEHMPLLTPGWTHETVTSFVAAKEERWAADGLGHWAFLLTGAYVGWGGFEKEPTGEWDFALVLKPECFGIGPAIAKKAISFAVEDPRIDEVVFQLAPSRRSFRVLERLGAERVGDGEVAGHRFLKFRLSTRKGPAA